MKPTTLENSLFVEVYSRSDSQSPDLVNNDFKKENSPDPNHLELEAIFTISPTKENDEQKDTSENIEPTTTTENPPRKVELTLSFSLNRYYITDLKSVTYWTRKEPSPSPDSVEGESKVSEPEFGEQDESSIKTIQDRLVEHVLRVDSVFPKNDESLKKRRREIRKILKKSVEMRKEIEEMNLLRNEIDKMLIHTREDVGDESSAFFEMSTPAERSRVIAFFDEQQEEYQHFKDSTEVTLQRLKEFKERLESFEAVAAVNGRIADEDGIDDALEQLRAAVEDTREAIRSSMEKHRKQGDRLKKRLENYLEKESEKGNKVENKENEENEAGNEKEKGNEKGNEKQKQKRKKKVLKKLKKKIELAEGRFSKWKEAGEKLEKKNKEIEEMLKRDEERESKAVSREMGVERLTEEISNINRIYGDVMRGMIESDAEMKKKIDEMIRNMKKKEEEEKKKEKEEEEKDEKISETENEEKKPVDDEQDGSNEEL